MLSNTFIVSEFVEILYSFPTWPCIKMCHTVPRPMHRTWQCVIWYHDQCISSGIMSYGTTTSVFHMAMCHAINTTSAFHLAMCHTVPQPVYFTWQCVMRDHNQCIAPGNVSCGTTPSVFHLTMCHTLPRPAPFTWNKG